MGCDIHIFVEVKKNNKWEIVKGKNPWYIWCKENNKDISEENKYCYEGWIYDNRNYRTFSLLADVRNGVSAWGDAPATGHYIKPLSYLKGLPEDATEYVREYLGYDCDIHSKNYLTLKELQHINWNEPCKMACLVDKKGYREFIENGMPESWCGGCSGYIISNHDMERYINGETVIGNDGNILKDNSSVHTLINFTVSISECCDDLKDVIEQLEGLLEDGITNEDIRIVFGFDN